MMKTLHNGGKTDPEFLGSKDGQPPPLCSNKEGSGCPSLGLTHLSYSENDALRYLAKLIVRIYLENKKRESRK